MCVFLPLAAHIMELPKCIMQSYEVTVKAAHIITYLSEYCKCCERSLDIPNRSESSGQVERFRRRPYSSPHLPGAMC